MTIRTRRGNSAGDRARAYRGATLGAAIERVRMDLGDTAVLLGTRKRRRFLGLGPDVVEVMAVPGPDRAATRTQPPAIRVPAAPPADHPPGTVAQALAELLETAGVRPDLAATLAGRALQGSRSLVSTKQLGTVLGDAIGHLAGGAYAIDVVPGTKRVVAFIGPAGCGKTTSLTKLACEMVLAGGHSVEIITADTVRPGAADQLARYAAILGVPFAVAHTPGELKRLCVNARADLVFVDTPGCTWRNNAEIASLAATLEAAAPAEVHAVLAATTEPELAAQMVSAFRPLGVDRVLLTRLDEVRTLGPVVNIACGVRIPLSYLTMGADLPGAMIVPAFPALAAALIGGEVFADNGQPPARLEVTAV